MIVLSSVTKFFGKKLALNKVNLKTKTGEIVGFLGPNGAGKTTTMRIILSYLEPSFGQISVKGSIGYLPENNPLYPEMRVAEYLKFIADIKGVDDFLETVQAVGLQEVIASKIEDLSRGFKQRVGLAAALLGNPDILILDEPTSGLDPLEQDKIKILIKKLAKKKTIIFSTHILSEVEAVANRLIILNKGSIVYDGVKPKARGGVEKLFKKLVK